MRERVRHDVSGVIEEYGLHRGLDPIVDISALRDRFPVRYEDLGPYGVRGLIIPPPGGWPAHEENKARVVLDCSLRDTTSHEHRLVYAHEVGHGLACHAGTLPVGLENLKHEEEQEAWKVAAHLLIPWWTVATFGDPEIVAEVCGVPVWLASLHMQRWPKLRG